jgi:hypothetical protein
MLSLIRSTAKCTIEFSNRRMELLDYLDNENQNAQTLMWPGVFGVDYRSRKSMFLVLCQAFIYLVWNVLILVMLSAQKNIERW